MTRAHEETSIYHSLYPPADVRAGGLADPTLRPRPPSVRESTDEQARTILPDTHTEPLGRKRLQLLDYTPGMLANRAVAWWQARRLARGNPTMREAWVKRLGGWENMSRVQKTAVAALDIGVAAVAVTALTRAGQVADVGAPDFTPWIGGYTPDTNTANPAAPIEKDLLFSPVSAKTDAPVHTPAHPQNPINAVNTLVPAADSTLAGDYDYRRSEHNSEPIKESALATPCTEDDTIESNDVGTFTKKTNPATGYLFGTAYNTIAESLIAQGVNPKQDIPAHEYHNMVGQVLAGNGWTWESARRSMQPGDALTIDREIFADYLPPPAPEPPPQPPPTESPAPEQLPPPEVENDILPATGFTWWHVAALGAATLVGGAMGYALGRRRYQPLLEDQRKLRKLWHGKKPVPGETKLPAAPAIIQTPDKNKASAEKHSAPPLPEFEPTITVPPPEKADDAKIPEQTPPPPPESLRKQLTLNPILGIKPPKRYALNPVLGIKPPKRPQEKETKQITSRPATLLPPQKPYTGHRGVTPLAFNPTVKLPGLGVTPKKPHEPPPPEEPQEKTNAVDKKPRAKLKKTPKKKRSSGKMKTAKAAAPPTLNLTQNIVLPSAEKAEKAKRNEDKAKKPKPKNPPEQIRKKKKRKKPNNKQRAKDKEKTKQTNNTDTPPAPSNTVPPPPPKPPDASSQDKILVMLGAGLNISIRWLRGDDASRP